jgi:head-tail adaptor
MEGVLMLPGRRDRKIVIERDMGTAANALNEAVPVWTSWKTVWAEKVEARGAEMLAFDRKVNSRIATFKCPFIEGLTPTDRVNEGGTIWNIIAQSEIGRRVGTEIVAEIVD